MRCLNMLWRDDAGFVVSSELVLVGTLGVVGATVGLGALSTAVNEELEDVAFSIRSLDQSYELAAVRGCGAWTAGSCFKQEPVAESLRDLEEQIDRDEARLQQRLKELEERDDDRPKANRDDDDDKPKANPEMKRPEPKKVPPKKKPRDRDADEEIVL
jgi:hypothetical protein